jgi:hypothetical protein
MHASVDPFCGWYPSSTAEDLGEHSSGSFLQIQSCSV